METSVWLWVGFNAFVLLLLAFDLGVFRRKSREISVREALWLSAGYVGLALAFNVGVFWFRGPQQGLEFLTGYLIEKSLSLDNVFVIALIFSTFAVPPAYQHRVLFWGILGALVMRAVLIFAGAALVMEFRWIVYLFGAFLIATGIKMLLSVGKRPDIRASAVVRFVKHRFRVTEDYEGERFWVRRGGQLYATPLFLALVMVEATDLVFAVDSIPAIFAITADPFIVYTSNVFAILGLRALYFALAGIIDRFRYLKHGLSLVLVLVGIKMMLVDVWKIPTGVALGATVAIIGGSILLSLWQTREHAVASGCRRAES
ncbi:MAG: TerC family protein [Pseudomonadota bacterium]|nr:TerC family protein [Pseudomonadota bacterium]